MSINATLLVQMIMFIGFIAFTMKFVWPYITKALADRQATIAAGLAAGERGVRDLELAQHKITEQLRDIKIKQSEIIDLANKRSNQIIEEAKLRAREEGARLVEMAKNDIQQEVNNAKQALRAQVAVLAVASAEKILSREIDASAHDALLKELITEL